MVADPVDQRGMWQCQHDGIQDEHTPGSLGNRHYARDLIFYLTVCSEPPFAPSLRHLTHTAQAYAHNRHIDGTRIANSGREATFIHVFNPFEKSFPG